VNILFLAILGVTQIWEPYRYNSYYHLATPWMTALALVRNLLVVALLAILVSGLVRPERAVKKDPIPAG
jgi:hypothetical protein